MGTFLIILAVVVFLWWSLVPKRPKEPSFNDFLENAERRSGEICHVYKNVNSEKVFGNAIYYYAKSPDNINDIKVFSGTTTECQRYINKNAKRL